MQLRFDVRNSPSLPERVKGSKGRRLDSKAKRGAVKSLRRDKPGQE